MATRVRTKGLLYSCRVTRRHAVASPHHPNFPALPVKATDTVRIIMGVVVSTEAPPGASLRRWPWRRCVRPSAGIRSVAAVGFELGSQPEVQVGTAWHGHSFTMACWRREPSVCWLAAGRQVGPQKAWGALVQTAYAAP